MMWASLAPADWPPIWWAVLGRAEKTGGNIVRHARANECISCGAPILTGLDDDWAALEAFTDTTPTDATGEALAILTKRPLYELGRLGKGWCLYRREPRLIGWPGRRPGEVDVLPAHICGQPLPEMPSVMRRATAPRSSDPGF